jgi:hypothetical protein
MLIILEYKQIFHLLVHIFLIIFNNPMLAQKNITKNNKNYLQAKKIKQIKNNITFGYLILKIKPIYD